MMRLRITGGRLAAHQACTIASIVRRAEVHALDITSRQNIQLRGIALRDVPQMLTDLSNVGIHTRQTGMDNVRNFIGCPLAGIDGMELFDSTPLLVALADAQLGLYWLANARIALPSLGGVGSTSSSTPAEGAAD